MYKIFIGWDSREIEAYEVCRKSIIENTNSIINIKPIIKDSLKAMGMYNRDSIYPNETASTEFAFSRFLVPYLSDYKGWSLFCDCDFVFTRDIKELFDLTNDNYSIMCVKHNYIPKTIIKMDGQKQTSYPRKNWSSMMLFNCESYDCKKLTLDTVNNETGAYLHQFKWIDDDAKIGEVPLEWNWLVGEYEKSSLNGHIPAVLHYTLGCPFMEGYENCDFAEEYNKYKEN